MTGIKNRDQFEESFNFILPGYNLRPLEMSGAIGGEQLKKLTEIIRGRRMNAEAFQDIMGGHPLIKIQKEIGKSSWFGFSLVVRPDVDYSREQLRKVLDSRGFEYRPIVAGNFVEQKVVKYMNYECFDKLVKATAIQRNGLFIGNHHYDVSSSLQALSDL